MLHEDIKASLKEAMKNKAEVELRTIRGMLTTFTNELVASGKTPQDTLPDDTVIAVIKRLAKQRQESIDQFTKAGRDDLVAPEEAELAYLKTYLPKMMSRDEIKPIATQKKTELNIADKSKMGMLIGVVMKELKGQADGGDVKVVVEDLF